MINFLFVDFGVWFWFFSFHPSLLLSSGFEKCNLCLKQDIQNTVRIVVLVVFFFSF